VRKPRAALATIAVAALAAASIPASALAVTSLAGGEVSGEGLEQVGAVEQEAPANGVYIVRMTGQPVSAYDGEVKGLKATKPAKGKKINPNGAAVVKYVDYLTARHDEAVAKVGGKKLQDYVYVYNGFSAKLSTKQAAAMAKVPGVLTVTGDEERTLDTSSTPDFLGLTDEGGLWDQLGDPALADKKTEGAGEDVIIGIVDGGIWPEHPSVSDRDARGKLAYQQIPGWHGRCVPGEEFNASMCNQKLIGARYYNAGWGGDAGIDEQLPWEFNSPRDYGGHGTHTATTAGGNHGVPATGEASVFGTVSGMAPRARIAAYKVCWETGAGGSCFTTDSVAAIDQAVADGVDVINFSVSGSRTSFLDPVEVAFLFAADAGVFVSTSAGNSGPATSTVAHPGPWLTTVAAGTHNRDGQGSVTLGNGATYEGASLAAAVGPAPLVNASAAALPGADPAQVALCYGESDGGAVLDPATVAGAILVCDRGVTARTNKSLAVKEAGGVGMILVNTSASSINADFHFVPTVHLQNTDAAAVHAYAGMPGATATINDATLVYDAPAPYTASFSSRGPLLAGEGDLLKPDVIAPGQDILAGVAPPGNHDRLFDLYSGTSMSSPHVAGLAALLIDMHPDWTPMMVKSALMTTGSDVLDGPNANPAVIFRQGAGHVVPNSAADPGLVFDSGWNDWLGFLCGTGQLSASYCPAIGIDPSDLNTASISIGSLAGTQTVTRTVTNVGDSAESYSVASTGLSGVTAAVSPASFSLAPGASQEVQVTFSRASAALTAYVGGQITWTGDKGHVVRIPAVVRPVALAAPATVSGTGDPISYDVSFGYDGSFSAAARGLVAPVVDEGTVGQDPDQTFTGCADTEGVAAVPVVIPAGSTYARFALFDSDVTPGTDLDLYICQGSGLVGASGTGTSDEEVNFSFASPTGSDIPLTAYVHGWGVAGGGTSPFALHSWGVPATADGTMSVAAPSSATLGASGTIELTFSGLDPATRYLGSVAYGGASGLPSPTIVTVTTP